MAAGAGHVATVPPTGALLAIDASGKRAEPKVSGDFSGHVKTNGWWSSLLYQHERDNPFSAPLYAHPLALRAEARGIGLSYPHRAQVGEREYMMRYDEDLLVGLRGLEAPDTRVASYSDFTVTAVWEDGAGSLRATFGHGLPFVYLARSDERPAEVRVAGKKSLEVFAEYGATLGVLIGGKPYGLYAPRGIWQRSERTFSSSLDGARHFSVALLPDATESTLADFERHAFAFVEDTRATWDVEGTRVETRFEAKTRLVEPCADGGATAAPRCTRVNEPLLALYRHQWKRTDAALDSRSYASPRGAMKLFRGHAFTTTHDVSGVLPQLPVAESARAEVARKLAELLDGELFPRGLVEKPDHDAYWDGKSLGRLSSAAELADAVAETELRDRLLDALAARLEDWFDGRAPRFFYYDARWSSLVAFPDSYGSAAQLNDHHFHYGYFVHAAATVARFRPAWARAYGPAVELLIRDVASPRTDDPLFPRLRHMDVYAGHSWASGPSFFAEGNNEESSSEDLNFSYATALWGAVTGNDEYLELGLYLRATQVAAVEEYWFDVDDAVFPKEFAHPTVAMVWGAGGKFDTWFDQDPTVVHAINYLPITAGSLYLGRHPEYVRTAFQSLLGKSYGEITTWRDYALMFAALGDTELAFEHYRRDTLFQPEFGNSRAMTVAFLSTLRDHGTPSTRVTASTPLAAVLERKGSRTVSAWNPSASPREVRFSDGTKLSVPPRRVLSRTVSAKP